MHLHDAFADISAGQGQKEDEGTLRRSCAVQRTRLFADTVDDFDNFKEVYAQLTDRLTGQPIAFDNLVVLYATHELYSPGIYDIQLIGSGDGVAFRDGQAYPVTWQRGSTDVVSLTNPDDTPYTFKPGTTWFEVMGPGFPVQQTGESWRFVNFLP